MIRRVHFEFGSIHSLFCDDDKRRRKREKKEREKRRTNASEPRQSHVLRLLLLLLVVVSGQRLSNMRDRMFFFYNDDSQAALFRRDQIIYSRPRDAFCTALVDPTTPHSISSSKILSLSLFREREFKQKKENFVGGGETQNKNKNVVPDGVFFVGVFAFFFLTHQHQHQHQQREEEEEAPNFYLCENIL